MRSNCVTTQTLLLHGPQQRLLRLTSFLEVTRHGTALQRRHRDRLAIAFRRKERSGLSSLHADTLQLVSNHPLDECSILHRASLERRTTVPAAVLIELQLLASLTLAVRLRSYKLHPSLAGSIAVVARRVASTGCQFRILVELTHSVIVCAEDNALTPDLTSSCRLQLADCHCLAKAESLLRSLCTLEHLSHLVAVRLRWHCLCLGSLEVRSVLSGKWLRESSTHEQFVLLIGHHLNVIVAAWFVL